MMLKQEYSPSSTWMLFLTEKLSLDLNTKPSIRSTPEPRAELNKLGQNEKKVDHLTLAKLNVLNLLILMKSFYIVGIIVSCVIYQLSHF